MWVPWGIRGIPVTGNICWIIRWFRLPRWFFAGLTVFDDTTPHYAVQCRRRLYHHVEMLMPPEKRKGAHCNQQPQAVQDNTGSDAFSVVFIR